MNAQIPEEVFEIGILDREFHARLISGLGHWASIAKIPEQFVWAKLSQYCTEEDVSWVRNMKTTDDAGLVYTGVPTIPIEDKFAAIAGVCLRNYIDARVFTVQEVVSELKNDSMPDSSVILVPNFCLGKDDSSNVAPWESSTLLGWLYTRLSKGLKTILYVSDFSVLEGEYGISMVKHLHNHYKII